MALIERWKTGQQEDGRKDKEKAVNMFEIVIMNHYILYLPKIIFNTCKYVHACIKKVMPIRVKNNLSRAIDFSKISIPGIINLPFELLVRRVEKTLRTIQAIAVAPSCLPETEDEFLLLKPHSVKRQNSEDSSWISPNTFTLRTLCCRIKI